MTTPLLEVIRQAYPQASITYVAGTYSKVVPEHHPAINTVIDSGTVGIPGRYSFYDYMKIANVLRKHHFDLAFVLDRSPMLTLLPWLAGIPRRIGPDSLGRGFSLTDRIPVSTSPTQLQHQAEIYLDLARAIGLPINHPRMRFEPTQDERSDVVGARFIAPTGSGGADATKDGLLQRTGMAARDYTGGEGLLLMHELLQAGALIVGSVAEAIETTRRYTTSNTASRT